MEEHLNQDPREIVEVYQRKLPGEIELTYSRQLPARMLPDDAEWWWEEIDARKSRRRRNLLIFLICLLAAVALAAAIWFWPRPQSPAFAPAQSSGGDETAITMATWPVDPQRSFYISDQGTEPVSIQEIYRRVNPSVVTVMVQLGESGGYTQLGVGTGVIFTEDGYIITNYHVLEGGSYCTVALDTGAIYQAKYVSGSEENDIALLKIDETGLPAAPFADSNDLVVGDTVYAIGNPLGVELRGTLTDGIVSAINRDVRVGNNTMTLIQTNAALNTGNSGGPLINQYGQVVGINVVKMVGSQKNSNVEGLGFAIPSASFERIVNDLIRCGVVQPKVSLGLQVLRAGEEVAEGVFGIMVQSADEGGASKAAGIRDGDYVIRAGGMEIRTSDDLLLARDRYYYGQEFPITVWREGEILEFMVKLEQEAGE